jgi:O-antigen ligase
MQIFRTIYTLTLLAFFVPAISFPGFWIAGLWGRWIMLAIAVVGVALIQAPSVHLPQMATAGLGVFLFYSLCTVFWSENGYLSLAKWVAYCLVVIAFFVGGFMLGGGKTRNPFSCFAPIAYLTLVSSVLALVYLRGRAFTENSLFVGYSYNPNMLGSMVACCTPWLLTEVYVTRADPKRRIWAVGIAVALFAILLATRSRAALLMASSMVLTVMVAVKPQGKLRAVIVVPFLVIFSYIAVPGLYSFINENIILKNSGRLLETRELVWDVSREKVRQAGPLGVGFGISVGRSSEWAGEVTSVGFSREKGSSVLAIWEEMGIGGLIVTAFLIVMLVLELLQAARAGASVAGKFYGFLTLGALLGGLGAAGFEAWFTAPGSPEIAAFWAMLGLGFGTLRRLSVAPEFVYEPA